MGHDQESIGHRQVESGSMFQPAVEMRGKLQESGLTERHRTAARIPVRFVSSEESLPALAPEMLRWSLPTAMMECQTRCLEYVTVDGAVVVLGATVCTRGHGPVAPTVLLSTWKPVSLAALSVQDMVMERLAELMNKRFVGAAGPVGGGGVPMVTVFDRGEFPAALKAKMR